MTTNEKITLYEKNIENIETMLSGISANNIEEYRINGRELKKYSIPDLVQLLNYFQNKLNSLKRPRKILVRCSW